jgi:amino acid adenylation domain-containing protein
MDRTIPGLLEHSALLHANNSAIFCQGEDLTFAELSQRAVTLADALAEVGVEIGARVGVYLRPSLWQPVAILGVAQAGAVPVPLHPNLMSAAVAHIAEDAGFAAIITEVHRVGDARAACPRAVIVTPTDMQNLESGWLAHVPADGAPSCQRDPAPDEVALLIYTSGSTGRPKGIMITHENVMSGAEIVSEYLGTNRTDRIAGLLSLNFDYGLNQLWQCLLVGSSLYLHDFVMPRTAFHTIADARITALPLMPALMQRLFAPNAGGVPDLDYSSVRYICTSGGAVSDWAVNRLEATFPNAEIVLMYGLTEAFRSTYLPPSDLSRKRGSVGRPIPRVSLHVVDEEENECPPGEIGTLIHRGGCISMGYWKNDEATANVFRRLKRFGDEIVVWTGDLAYKDTDGYLYIRGRSDGQLKRDGFRISPNDVELAINAHPAVADSVVLGVPDGDRGHRLIVLWIERAGQDGSDGPSHSWLVQHLAAHTVPSEIYRLDEFPTIPNQGKVDRMRLAQMLAEGAFGRTDPDDRPSTGQR